MDGGVWGLFCWVKGAEGDSYYGDFEGCMWGCGGGGAAGVVVGRWDGGTDSQMNQAIKQEGVFSGQGPSHGGLSQSFFICALHDYTFVTHSFMCYW